MAINIIEKGRDKKAARDIAYQNSWSKYLSYLSGPIKSYSRFAHQGRGFQADAFVLFSEMTKLIRQKQSG